MPPDCAQAPWARAVVSIWVLVVVPVLLTSLFFMVVTLPRIVGTALAGLARQWDMLWSQFQAGDALGVIVRLLSIVALALPVLGTGYILVRVVRQVASGIWCRTGGEPVRRAVAGTVAVAVLASLVWAWGPDEQRYRPIQADERGTLADVLPAAARVSSGFARRFERHSPDDLAGWHRAADPRVPGAVHGSGPAYGRCARARLGFPLGHESQLRFG